jgi:hypothetical protein
VPRGQMAGEGRAPCTGAEYGNLHSRHRLWRVNA